MIGGGRRYPRPVARVALRHRENAEGAWFVDTRCIDCGTCREIAPEIFSVAGDQSIVAVQPDADEHGQLRRLARRPGLPHLVDRHRRPPAPARPPLSP